MINYTVYIKLPIDAYSTHRVPKFWSLECFLKIIIIISNMLLAITPTLRSKLNYNIEPVLL